MKTLTLFLLTLAATGAYGQTTVPNTFTSGTPAVATEVNDNFTALAAAVDNVALTPGPAGVDGQDGADGATGPQGSQGIPGSMGAPGTNGSNGADGLPGADGTNGTNGADGADGADGTNGTDGVDGVDGVDGPPGVAGPAGAQPFSVVGTDGVELGIVTNFTWTSQGMLADVLIPIFEPVSGTNGYMLAQVNTGVIEGPVIMYESSDCTGAAFVQSPIGAYVGHPSAAWSGIIAVASEGPSGSLYTHDEGSSLVSILVASTYYAPPLSVGCSASTPYSAFAWPARTFFAPTPSPYTLVEN